MGRNIPLPTPNRIRQVLNDPRLIRAWTSTVLGRTAYLPYAAVALSALSRYHIGNHIFDEEWDLLIVLDTCRVDALREVAPEYDFIGEIDSTLSLGSKTSEWTIQTFREDYIDEIANTAYITASPMVEEVLDSGVTPEEHSSVPFAWTNWSPVHTTDFAYFEPAWNYLFDGSIGHPEGPTPPQYTADRAISTGRNVDADRYIVHFIQPHAPYTQRAITEGRKRLSEREKDFEFYLRKGYPKRNIWELYLHELRFGLDSVAKLLDNFDAEEVVITADHGEGFGEWGGYEHPSAAPHPQIRRVPWVETSAADSGSYEPEYPEPLWDQDTSVEERLRNLGYK